MFPGAFKPAHQAHLAAIVDLARRPEIDEVVVVVANRARQLPGTTLALDAEVARQVLEVYLHDVAKTRVEVAPHNAVSHALGYLDRAAPGDALLFCIGEADHARGDDRFEDLLLRQQRGDVTAHIVPVPTGTLAVRATALREALVAGEARRAEFTAALPAGASPQQHQRVWAICRHGMREMSDIVERKLRTTIIPRLLSNVESLVCITPNKLDPVFRAQLRNGQQLIVKYAGETTQDESFGPTPQPKPRRRLSAERRALKCLYPLRASEFELAEVRRFDKETLTLVLSEVLPGAMTLQQLLHEGVFDTAVLTAAAQFLATCHSSTAPALWGEPETDRRQWAAMLALRTVGMDAQALGAATACDLRQLAEASDAARSCNDAPRVFHLDFEPKNILVARPRIGFIDFECCSSVGDPAYDLGVLLGHCVLWGLRTQETAACQTAIGVALHTYGEQVGARWSSLRPRVIGFAGAAMLHALLREHNHNAEHADARAWDTASALVAPGVHERTDVEAVF
ncbi:MAG: phosphotransferase, partial [Burkholderiaceae bacterium]|nr:phosphotransferase [Burkholderiaceae bacterium]